MKIAKIIGAYICFLSAMGSLPSVYLSLIGGYEHSVAANNTMYFAIKVFLYILVVALLLYLSFRLVKSAKSKQSLSLRK